MQWIMIHGDTELVAKSFYTRGYVVIGATSSTHVHTDTPLHRHTGTQTDTHTHTHTQAHTQAHTFGLASLVL